MELLVNDQSICGQFPDIDSFNKAISGVMKMREIARQFEHEIYCHRNMCHAQVTNTMGMQQVIQHLKREQQRALMLWLTRHGPYWDDDRVHGPDDYLECNNQVVTDTAIGEAAFRCFNKSDYRLISLIPSSWKHTPLSVCWHKDINQTIAVTNYISTDVLETDLRSAPPILATWEELAHISYKRFPNLTFAKDSFKPLKGHPFVQSAAQRIIERLQVLEKMKCCFDKIGGRTPEGHKIYKEYFTGDKAWFSDSSEDEKKEFKNELTFKHPDRERETLFCTMHGKVNNSLLRIHFSWPVSQCNPLYVVYVGPKITKR